MTTSVAIASRAAGPRRSTLLALAGVALFGALTWMGVFPPVTLKPMTELDLIALGSALLVASVIIERVVEVFIAADRGSQAAAMDHAIEQLQGQLKAARAGGVAAAEAGVKAQLESADAERVAFRTETRRISLIFAFLLGSLTAAIGVRVFYQLVDGVAFHALEPGHQTFFNLIDILLTGAFLAGGSEGIHRFAKVYTDFMDSLAKKQAADAARHAVEAERYRGQGGGGASPGG